MGVFGSLRTCLVPQKGALMLTTIAFTNFIDYLLLTAVVPVIPDFLVQEDEKSAANSVFSKHVNSSEYVHGNLSVPSNGTIVYQPNLIDKALHIPIEAISENSRVGWLLGSKALVQIAANPLVGYLSNRFPYKYLLMFGTSVFLVSSTTFAVSEDYVPLLIARASQGVGSAFTAIAGMSMLASRYHDDGERSKAMGVAMGGCALGILVGYPFGGLLYAVAGKLLPFLCIACLSVTAICLQQFTIGDGNCKELVQMDTFAGVSRLIRDHRILICAGAIMVTSMSLSVLESTVPIWTMDTMGATQWQLGLIFLPDSIGYLVGTNGFPVIAKTYGRWIFTAGSMVLIGSGMFIIPFSRKIGHILVPHLCLGIGVGVTDAAIMPLLALLVDQHHAASYGLVYSITQLSVCLAYSLGPSIAGLVVKGAGFQWAMWGMALLNLLYTPLCAFLRQVSAPEESQCILGDMDSSNRNEADRKSFYETVD